MPENWSQQEVEAIVTDYFVMLADELQGKRYNKAEHNRNLQKLLNNRDRVSVEFKHRNISAVLWQLDYPYIDGYKPLPRYQGLLRQVIEERLTGMTELNQTVAKSVQTQIKVVPPVRNLKAIQVPPPSRKEVKSLVQDASRRKTVFVQRNYIEAEAKNRSIGSAGEEFILRFEHERLWREGKRKLADQIEHVSKTKGDFVGYDILSFEANGREKFIEVKTTQYAAMTRFFASANEVEVPQTHADKYQLHRLFHFDKQPKFFVLAGSLRDTCQLSAANYSAVPN
jgi:Domain of unknown function (DUF3883)